MPNFHSLAPLLAFIVAPAVLQAQSTAPASTHGTTPVTASGRPSMSAGRLNGHITLDGVLDEPAWAAAPVSTHFTQSYPNPGAPPTDSTQVRVLYDNAAMYVGVRMFDREPRLIAAQLARRDATGIYSDWLHVMVGSYHDHRTAFRFSVNPLGVKKDVLEYNDTNEDLNWDAVWDVATRVDSLGWTAEYRIPFSQLRFGSKEPAAGRVWDLGIMRDIARTQERDTWAPWTANSPGFVSSFGEIDGIAGVPAPQRLEILPYASAKVTRAPGSGADPFYHSSDSKLSAGADVKYGLPNGLTLTGTANPDFGQVEVDPAVVNLSAFETFFPEKRPFFLEGSDIFAFGTVRRSNDYGSQNYFYSRRIGRSPQGSANGPDVAYVDAPSQTTILGAAKLTGKTAGGWSVGMLDALTARENARIATTSGVRRDVAVEPSTNYFVGRLQRDLRQGNTLVGGMLMSTDRALGDSALASVLRGHAMVGGVDFEHAWDSRTWVTSGYLAASQVTGTASAIAATQRSSARYYQRPDASYLHFDPSRTSLAGHMGELAIARTGAVNGSIAVKEVSPGFEMNDLGFQSRVDYRSLATSLGYQSVTPGKTFRSYSVYTGTTSAWNFGGTSVFQSPYVGGNGTFTNLWTAQTFIQMNPPYFSDRFTRGGPLALVPRGWSVNVGVGSDTRKPVTVSPTLFASGDASGASDRNLSLGVDMRPASFIHVNLAPTIDHTKSTGQYVRAVSDPLATATYGRRYVFADLDQTTLSLDTRLDWTFTPNLTLQLYAQPFVSAGKYNGLKELRAPRTYDFNVYGRDAGTITSSGSQYTIDPNGAGAAPSFTVGNPDFNIRSLHGDAVLRWEYRPGSTLYFVWQQERSDFAPIGDFALQRDAGAIFRAQPTNVFLVKVAYWLGR